MKQLFLLSLIGISLTGCIVAPYDDGPRHSRYDDRSHHRHDGRDRRYERKTTVIQTVPDRQYRRW
ncbi:hypothetical protein [Acinetobacter stercoris]|uniref:Lipoprotein n=1 Tax=Acinetobacter stercoris TaxID=2126983 RepID=A0A2U3N1S8_9GAMM|nr:MULTISPECIES: hypothetical protein [Acinetobacter]SPL71618.1 hypothetical protein KPC_2796 [Acinetobacter stercoris]